MDSNCDEVFIRSPFHLVSREIRIPYKTMILGIGIELRFAKARIVIAFVSFAVILISVCLHACVDKFV